MLFIFQFADSAPVLNALYLQKKERTPLPSINVHHHSYSEHCQNIQKKKTGEIIKLMFLATDESS